MNEPSSKCRSPETTLILIEMVKRGWQSEDLARACGLDYRHLRNMVAMDFFYENPRIIVENTLGMPIWSPPWEFQVRQALAKRFGGDLALMSKVQLLGIAKRLCLPSYVKRASKATLRKAIFHKWQTDPEMVNKIYPLTTKTNEEK